MPAVMRAAGFFVKKVRELAVAAQQVALPAFAGPRPSTRYGPALSHTSANGCERGSNVPGRGDVVFIFLRVPLRHQEAVIAAAATGIFAADSGAGGIDRA